MLTRLVDRFWAWRAARAAGRAREAVDAWSAAILEHAAAASRALEAGDEEGAARHIAAAEELQQRRAAGRTL